MTVLSLFDGISCGHVALDKLGIPIDRYVAYEIDKYAISVTQHNYPNTECCGTVFNGDYTQYKGFDILLGGSPCQHWSIAKTNSLRETTSSGIGWDLFSQYLRALQEAQPRYFFYENVASMSTTIKEEITHCLGVQPIMIDSALLSAQSRKRLYWTNIPNVVMPQDKGLLLQDIVHEYVDEKYTLSTGEVGYMLRGNNKWGQAGDCRFERYTQYPESKSFTVTANIHKGVPYNCYFQSINEYIVPFDKTLQILDKEVQAGKVGFFRKDSQANRVYYVHNKGVTLCGDAGGGAAKMGQYLFGCLTPDRVEKRQDGQRFNDGNKFYTLTSQDKHGVLIEGYIRKLTPVEAERLQTLPDNYTALGAGGVPVSDTQRYKCLGNGWTVDVVAHILRGLLRE